MTKMPSYAEDRYAHLRANAAAQKQETVNRLTQAIAQLETEGREVSTFTIKEVCGLDYMAYYRNAEALALFRKHSTHLREERAKRRHSKRANPEHDEVLHQGKVAPRDPLLAYKKPELVAKLRVAQAERDQIQQCAQRECEEKEQRYLALLQEHMQCGLTIAKLEAQLAEYLAFMQRFRSALSSEEHGSQH